MIVTGFIIGAVAGACGAAAGIYAYTDWSRPIIISKGLTIVFAYAAIFGFIGALAGLAA